MRFLLTLTSVFALNLGLAARNALCQGVEAGRGSLQFRKLANLPPASNSRIAPHGRWMAVWDARDAHPDQAVFYDLRRGSVWRVHLLRNARNQYPAQNLAWRDDGQACAVGSSGGWQVIWPALHRVQVVWRLPSGGGGSAAWAKRSHRLAIFDDNLWGSGLYRVWNGRRLSRGINWAHAVGFPYEGEAMAWSSGWSPDERSLWLRFYGQADRASWLAAHTVVVDPRTARPRFDWGAEARPARWLDNSRLMFETDEDGIGTPEALVVARPHNHQGNEWMRQPAIHVVSVDGRTAWALSSGGDLWRTPTRRKKWQLVRRHAVSSRFLRGVKTALLSPRGDSLAVCDIGDARSITLLSTSPRHPWTAIWNAPSGTASVVGWAAGKSLPILRWQAKEGAPATLIQLEKRAH